MAKSTNPGWAIWTPVFAAVLVLIRAILTALGEDD